MPKTCVEDGCDKPRWAMGRCLQHDKVYNPHKYEIKKKGIAVDKLIPKVVKHSFIKPISDKKAIELKEYRIVRDTYFKLHPTCEYPNCNSTDITLHHKRGKIGSLLTDSRYFCSLCFSHHRIAEENPILAKELGLSLDRLSK